MSSEIEVGVVVLSIEDLEVRETSMKVSEGTKERVKGG